MKRGDLDMKVYRHRRTCAPATSEMLIAPPIGGGALQITHLLHTGAGRQEGRTGDGV